MMHHGLTGHYLCTSLYCVCMFFFGGSWRIVVYQSVSSESSVNVDCGWCWPFYYQMDSFFSCLALALALSFLLLFIVLPVSVRLPLDLSLISTSARPILSLSNILPLPPPPHSPSIYFQEKRELALHNPSHLHWILSFSLPYELIVYFSVFRMIAAIFLQRLRNL